MMFLSIYEQNKCALLRGLKTNERSKNKSKERQRDRERGTEERTDKAEHAHWRKGRAKSDDGMMRQDNKRFFERSRTAKSTGLNTGRKTGAALRLKINTERGRENELILCV